MKRLGKASGSLFLIKLQTCNLLSKVIDKDIPTQDFFHVYFAEWDYIYIGVKAMSSLW